jgi:hypothetical protein
MTIYNVHIYREMRLFFPGIEAATPETAAQIAADKLTTDAEYTEDCDGENLAAMIDVVVDDDFSRTVTIDFEVERLRKAAPMLLAALEGIIFYAENEAFALEKHRDRSEAAAEAEKAWSAIEAARAAITAATAERRPA